MKITARFTPLALIATFLLLPLLRAADAPAPDPSARLAEARKLIDGLKLRSGEIVLPGGIAKANLPATLRYLDPADTETVLTKLWHNPKGDRTLGMLVPQRFNPLTDDAWAVVITYDEDGYVKDDDAAKIDYNKLLAEMKEGVREASKEREKQGFAAIELVGWATPPRYDASAKKLYWAKELKFGDSPSHTLNYNIRMLGRRGVLVLNAIADMSQLKLVESAAPALLAAVNFQEGNRYADFDPSKDKVATYGLAALVAGGIAAKTGLLKVLWVGLLALKKFIIIALIALAGAFKKIWAWIRGRKGKAAAATTTEPAAVTASAGAEPSASTAAVATEPNPAPPPSDAPPPAV